MASDKPARTETEDKAHRARTVARNEERRVHNEKEIEKQQQSDNKLQALTFRILNQVKTDQLTRWKRCLALFVYIAHPNLEIS